MSKRLLAALCLAGFLAGALVACGYANADESPERVPAAGGATEETPPPAAGSQPTPPQVEPDREKCDAWIAFMVDGVLMRGPGVMVSLPALTHISVACLGRFPHPLERSPHPLRPAEPNAPPPINPGEPKRDAPANNGARLIL